MQNAGQSFTRYAVTDMGLSSEPVSCNVCASVSFVLL